MLRNRDQGNVRILTAKVATEVDAIGTIQMVATATRAEIGAEVDQEIGRLGLTTARNLKRASRLVVSRRRCLLEAWTTSLMTKISSATLWNGARSRTVKLFVIL